MVMTTVRPHSPGLKRQQSSCFDVSLPLIAAVSSTSFERQGDGLHSSSCNSIRASSASSAATRISGAANRLHRPGIQARHSRSGDKELDIGGFEQRLRHGRPGPGRPT